MSVEKFKDLACELMSAGRFDPAKHGLEFRANRGLADVNRAIEKARKNGHQKTEFEQSMLECYLGNVLKVRK